MVRLANQVVTQVRQRTQQQVVMGHRGRKGDPLYDIRRLLLVGEERLSDSARRRLDAALAHRDGDLLRRGGLCLGGQRTLLRHIYAAYNLRTARRRLEAFHAWAETVEVPEVDRLSRTLRTWEEETLNYHRTGATNGPTEAVNLIIEKTRRLGHGFRNWDN